MFINAVVQVVQVAVMKQHITDLVTDQWIDQ